MRVLLEDHGIETIDADKVGHEVLQSDGAAFDEVAARWPDVVVDGEIDRRSLADVVFGDRDELNVLESITHPVIFDLIRARVEEIPGTVVVEIPLLAHGFGSEWRRMVVDARDEIRLDRAIARGMDEADVHARMAAQPSRAEWLASADLVVPNHGTFEELTSTARRLVPNL